MKRVIFLKLEDANSKLKINVLKKDIIDSLFEANKPLTEYDLAHACDEIYTCYPAKQEFIDALVILFNEGKVRKAHRWWDVFLPRICRYELCP